MTILQALNLIAECSSQPKDRNMECDKKLLSCMYINPTAVVGYHASDIILNVHSDASCLSAGQGRSRAGRHSFLGSLPKEGTPIKLNGNIAITCAILKLVAASAAEAELGALFLNVQEARILRLILYEMGHPQPQTPVHVDNTTCVGIVNNTIKRQ